MNLQIFNIYLMWTVAYGSAYSNNLQLTKTPKPITLCLFKKNWFNAQNPKLNKTHWVAVVLVTLCLLIS